MRGALPGSLHFRRRLRAGHLCSVRGGSPVCGSGLPQSVGSFYLLSGSRQCTSFLRGPFRVEMRAGAAGRAGTAAAKGLSSVPFAGETSGLPLRLLSRADSAASAVSC